MRPRPAPLATGRAAGRAGVVGAGLAAGPGEDQRLAGREDRLEEGEAVFVADVAGEMLQAWTLSPEMSAAPAEQGLHAPIVR